MLDNWIFQIHGPIFRMYLTSYTSKGSKHVGYHYEFALTDHLKIIRQLIKRYYIQ